MCAGYTCRLGSVTICSTLNRFFSMTKLLSKTVSIKPLGPKKPGQVTLSILRYFDFTDLRGRSNDPVIFIGHRQRASTTFGQDLEKGSTMAQQSVDSKMALSR